MDQADGDRPHALGQEPVERVVDRGAVERDEDVAAMVEALVDGHPPATRDERRRPLELEVVQARKAQPADLEHVAETLGRQQAGRGAAPFEDGVRRDRRAVQDLAERRGVDPGRGEQLHRAGNDRGRIVVGGRQDLAGERGAIRADQDKVREGPAHVDAEPVRRTSGVGLRLLVRHARTEFSKRAARSRAGRRAPRAVANCIMRTAGP